MPHRQDSFVMFGVAACLSWQTYHLDSKEKKATIAYINLLSGDQVIKFPVKPVSAIVSYACLPALYSYYAIATYPG